MPTCSFSNRWIEAIKLPETGQLDYFDERTTGLGLRLSSAGQKSWFVMYRHAGRLRRYTMGTYPGLGIGRCQRKSEDITT